MSDPTQAAAAVIAVEYLAKHSSGKDHLAMTGGTLGADKRVSGPGPLRLQHDFFPVTTVDPAEPGAGRDRLFSGIHSIEHALASPDGGDLRAQIARVTGLGPQFAARLIDMSPYIPGLLKATGAAGLPLGFRSSFVTPDGDADGEGGPLPTDQLIEAYRLALRLIREKFRAGEPVPFATPEACGQYNLHSPEVALELIEIGLEAVATAGAVTEAFRPIDAAELYVCDLRLVKPRLPGAFDQQVLDLLGGHLLSQRVEEFGVNLTAGNFGCSTGEYLMVANPEGLGRQELLDQAHREVAAALAESGSYTGSDALRRAAAVDARFSLEHIEKYSPAALSG
jgi:S-ribosylhomocysteine lyase LuxS involved in autoinducer biosynthesis